MAVAAEEDNESYILPSTNEELKSFTDKHKLDMMNQVVNSIKYALDNNLPMIEVFQFKNSQFVITISDKEFESNLDNIYHSYMEKEAYELCPGVIKIIELLKQKHAKQKTTPTKPNNNTNFNK